ncbi:MAG: helix-turn-helix domain-containing protein [Bacteroidota bacterium]
MQFSWSSILLIFAALQAALLIIGLWRRGQPATIGRKLLTILLVNVSLVLLHHGVLISLPDDTPYLYAFNGLATACWFAIPPALYLYIRALTEREFRWQTRYWWWFSLSIYNLITWLLAWAGIYFGAYLLFTDPGFYVQCYAGSYLVSGTIFGLLAYWQLHYRRFTPRLERRIAWLRWYLLAFVGAMLLSLAILIWLAIQDRYSAYFEYSILAVFALLLFALVYQSFHYSPYLGFLSQGAYHQTDGSSAALAELAQRIDQYFKEEAAYLRPDLSLADLAKALSVGESRLSQVFTQHHNSNFYTYVNGYRLQAFEARLKDPDVHKFTISAVASECGFKSKTSLYKVFREKHGTTPAAYLKQ